MARLLPLPGPGGIPLPDPGRIPLSLYIHWPWCVRKCPYCDFNSRACGGSPPTDSYVDCLLSDLRAQAAYVPADRTLQTIYIGGGTPSLMRGGEVARLLAGVARVFPLAPGCEVSMEANPGTVEKDSLGSYREAGVNRLSLGIQSFCGEELRKLGRIHGEEEARAAAAQAAEAFDNFNLDIMFGLPGETMETLSRDIRSAIGCGSTHLSFYQLTIEEGTAFAKRVPDGIPDPDRLAEMGDLVTGSLARAGFRRYEVSGYAREGFRCRHNLNYWQYGDYLAVGAGAHGKISTPRGVFRYAQEPSPDRYMARCRKGGLPFGSWRWVGREELPFEFMLDALRLPDGVPQSLFEERTGLPVSSVARQAEEGESLGLFSRSGGLFRATARGMDFLSDLQELFL